LELVEEEDENEEEGEYWVVPRLLFPLSGYVGEGGTIHFGGQTTTPGEAAQ
jgi:hypothetical protein